MKETLDFEAAKNYIFTYGRKLEQKRYLYHFENGSKDAVLEELVKYQNEDGGFGHGLESDLRSINSSVLATDHALTIFREINIHKHPSIDKAIDYLLHSYDSEKMIFPIINSGVLDTPVPWWWANFQKFFSGFIINPTAEVLSHLLYFDSLVPGELYDIVISRIKSMDSIDINSLICIRLLIESGKLDNKVKNKIIEHLIPLIKSELKKEEKWDGSGIYPLVVARFLGDVFESAVTEDQIQEHFKYDIESQNEDGSWSLNWDWSDVDEKLWKLAEKEWKGVFILEKMRVWKAYNRF